MDFNAFMTAIITNGIGAACAAGVLWFAYYRETRTLPAMMKEFAGSLKAQQEVDEKRINKIIDTFATVMREERTVCQKWHEENRQRLENIANEVKEVRHYIKDLAHQIGLRRAVDEERRKAKETGEDT